MFRILAAIVAVALLASCSGPGGGISPVIVGIRQDPRPVDVTQFPPFALQGWKIEVPKTLRVSEANTYKPVADIVWRGDDFGDRYAQIEQIFDTAMSRVKPHFDGNLPLAVQIRVEKFHAVTQKTRYSFSGLHEIEFILQANNAVTGEIVIPAYRVNTTFRALGGYEALDAERRGITQKVRIIDQLERRIQEELAGLERGSLPTRIVGAQAEPDASTEPQS